MTTKRSREDVVARFYAARDKKRQCVAELEKMMKESYEKRTGNKAETFFTL